MEPLNSEWSPEDWNGALEPKMEPQTLKWTLELEMGSEMKPLTSKGRLDLDVKFWTSK